MEDYYYFMIQGYRAPFGYTTSPSSRTLLGTIVTGVQLIAWTETPEGRRNWLQRRSTRKNVHPGKLGVTAGGNSAAGERPIDSIVREAFEETSFPEDYTRAHIQSCGTITYHLATNSDGSQVPNHTCSIPMR